MEFALLLIIIILNYYYYYYFLKDLHNILALHMDIITKRDMNTWYGESRFIYHSPRQVVIQLIFCRVFIPFGSLWRGYTQSG